MFEYETLFELEKMLLSSYECCGFSFVISHKFLSTIHDITIMFMRYSFLTEQMRNRVHKIKSITKFNDLNYLLNSIIVFFYNSDLELLFYSSII